MMRSRRGQQLAGVVVLCAVSFCGLAGCQRQKKSEDGKTYTPDSKGKQGGSQAGGGAGGGGGQSDANKPLDEPADTVNGKESSASDAGSSSATQGQPVAEPGAPVEHNTKKRSFTGHSSNGHT